MTDTEADDEALIARSRSGDERAIRLLVERHLETAFRIAFRIVGQRAEAEDIAQDVLLRMLSYRQGWFSKASFHAWMRRSVVNRAIDTHRRRRWWLFSELQPSTPYDGEGADQESTLATNQIEGRVAAAVRALPVRQRAAVTLCFFENMSLAEAAAALETSPGAIESLLHRAKGALRDNLRNLLDEGGRNVARRR